MCTCTLPVSGQIDVFLKAFPNANITALYELPAWVFEDRGAVTPTPPRLLLACPSLPVPPDTDNVRNLRPGNIRIVMAMGDSITAAMSAKDTTILSMKEYRGIAYSIGGDAGISTFPNLLKPFLPAGFPIGASTGVGDRTKTTTGFNAAVSGAINSDMLGQAQWLVTQLKAAKNVNMTEDWKVLSVWIGSNNLCDVCSNQPNNNGANFQTQLTNALEYLYSNVPRLFVNLVANLNIAPLYNINNGACSFLHSVACGCVGTSNSASRALVSSTAEDYMSRAYTVAQTFNSRNKIDFAVVVQPFLTKTAITDRSQLSAADCFHPSASAHATAAVALWNNVISPAAKKQTAWNANDVPICPTYDTLFYTN